MTRAERAAAAALMLLTGGSAAAEPLRQADSEALYERVVMRRDVQGRVSPGEAAAQEGAARALRPYYVFGREAGWLRMGRSPREEDLIWVPQDRTLPWKHNIVLTFTARAARERALFFDSRGALEDIVFSEDLAGDAAFFRARAETAETAEAARRGGDRSATGAPVIALGPEKGIDDRQYFHYLPILEFDDGLYFDDTGDETLGLRVLILNKRPADAAPPVRREFRAGVAFVIDATRSMQPYIDGTGRFVNDTLKTLRGSSEAGQIGVALVGFRDSLEGNDDLGYLTETFLPMSRDLDPGTFDRAIAGMNATSQSSHQFREDSFAGVAHAIDARDWQGYDARYVVLVTDASPRDGDDPLSETRLGAREVANYVAETGRAALVVVHLLTGERPDEHARATRMYRIAAGPGGAPDRYEAAGAQIVARVIDSLDPEARTTGGGSAVPVEEDTASAFDEALGRMARAFQLDYLGAVAGTRPPRSFEGWALERDFDERSYKPFAIRLLVTRNELDDLRTVIREEQDSGLPCKSQAMQVSETGWDAMSIPDQQQFIKSMRDKLSLYERYYDDKDQWVRLHPEDTTADEVFPLPLDDLP